MRKRVLHWESNPCRLLPLLLVVILSIIGVHSVHGSFNNRKEFKISKDILKGNSDGVSNKGHYRLFNRCSDRAVQIRPGGRMKRKGKVKGFRKGRVDAKAKNPDNSTKLVFESYPGGLIYIKSDYLKRYICFNRKGKIVLKYHGSDLCLFVQKEAPGGYYEFQSAHAPSWYLGFGKNGKKLPQWHRSRRRKKRCFHFVVKKIYNPQNYSPLNKTNLRKIVPFSSKKR